MSGAATTDVERRSGQPSAPAAGPGRAFKWRPVNSLACILALVAVVLPPSATAAWLAGRDAPAFVDIVTGVWIFKALLLFHATALPLLTARFASVPALASTPDAGLREGSLRPALWLTAGLLIGAFALRMVDLGAGLWHDEMATMVEYGNRELGEIISTYTSQNQHPLYSVLARLSIAVFGSSPWALRLPAVVLGVLSLGAVAWLGRQLVTRREALLATLLLAVSYHHVWFSQNARGYTGLMLFATLGTGLFLRLLENGGRGRWRTVIGYAACMALAIWTHLTAAFIVAAHFVVWLVCVVRAARGPGRWSFAGAALAAMLLAGTLALQLYALILPQVVATVFAPKPEFGATPWRSPLWMLAETVRGASRGLPGGWFGLAAGTLVGVIGIVSLARRRFAVPALLLLPGVLTAGGLVAVQHNLWPRFFFFAAGFAVLIAVRGVFACFERFAPRRGAQAATALLLLAAAGSAFTVPRAWGPKQDYAGALAMAASARGPGEPVAAAGLAAFALREYMQREDIQPVHSAAELTRLEQAGRVWLIYSFSTHLAAAEPDVWSRIEREYRRVAAFPGTVGGGTVYLVTRP